MNPSVTSQKAAGLALLPLLLLPVLAIVRLHGTPNAAGHRALAQTPVPPSARPPNRQPMTGPFSLIAVTHLSQRFGFLTPPEVAAPQASDLPGTNQPVMALSEGTGLRINVLGGVGYQVQH